jgi:hypothetical protein
VSRPFEDLYEQAGRRIYESQQARLSDKTCLAAKRHWRSKDVPQEFWDSYCSDARAALSIGETESAFERERELVALLRPSENDNDRPTLRNV